MTERVEKEEKEGNVNLSWFLMPFYVLATNWTNVKKSPNGEGLLGIERLMHGPCQ